MDRQTIWPAPYYPWIFDKEQRMQLGRAGRSYQQESNLNYGGEGYRNPFQATLKRVVGGTFWFRTYPSEEEAPRGTCWKHEPTTNRKIYASYQNTSPNTTHRIERTFYSSSFRIENQTQLNLHQKLTYTPNIYLNYFGLSIRVEKWSDVTREVLVIPGWVNGGPPKTLYLVVKENVTPIVIVSPATYVRGNDDEVDYNNPTCEYGGTDKPKNIFSRYKWAWIGAGIALIVGIGIILVIVLVRVCRGLPTVSSAFNRNLNMNTDDMEWARHRRSQISVENWT
ncbi:unnamed protein product, partial [Mesorhabditis belari]|uniref:Uncharacterized protein n=1 Tax=Mesorhabditis belari TaxID=2138241 RepID=A0AAF3ECC2_9BILA